MSRATAAAAAPRQGSPSDSGEAPGAISRARPHSDSGRPARPFLWGQPGLLHRFGGVPGEVLKPLFAKQEPKGQPTRHAKAKATAPVRAPWAAPASQERNSATNLVDLPVRAIANHFHQLENPGRVLEKRGKGGQREGKTRAGLRFGRPMAAATAPARRAALLAACSCCALLLPAHANACKQRKAAQGRAQPPTNPSTTPPGGSPHAHPAPHGARPRPSTPAVGGGPLRAAARPQPRSSPAGRTGRYPPDFSQENRSPFSRLFLFFSLIFFYFFLLLFPLGVK